VVWRGAAGVWRISSLALVSSEILAAFREHFSDAAVPAIYRAPGRVNLIGEHTDYNLGFVLPIALEMSCYVAIAPASHGQLRIFSRDIDEEFDLPVNAVRDAHRTGKWHDYVIGVALQLSRSGLPIHAADIWIASEVPVGAGLSSSAALEVSGGLALLNSTALDRLELARLAQRAESQFVGMPCGIMDQYASVFGQEHSALKIDCRDLTHEDVPLPEGVEIIAVNSLVKHELGTSAYRERVAECALAVSAIQEAYPSVQSLRAVQSLRDVPLPLFQQIQDAIPALPRKRARHVISDSQRVVDFAAASRAQDLNEMGRLFVASHRSMQYDYEISCEEIDFLVDTAIKFPGVYGSRMTGGGFGGCTVNLVAPGSSNEFRERLTEAYHERYSIKPAFYECVPAQGAGRLP
jgi:galactokinase